jgi:hypothetical protein
MVAAGFELFCSFSDVGLRRRYRSVHSDCLVGAATVQIKYWRSLRVPAVTSLRCEQGSADHKLKRLECRHGKIQNRNLELVSYGLATDTVQ